MRLHLLPIFLAATAASAEAQPIATSFDELRTRLTPGQSIAVTDAAGTVVNGTVIAVTPDSLQLRTGPSGAATPLTLAERQVNHITTERSDPLWNGMLIGFASGAAPVALLGLGSSASAGEVGQVALGYGAIGLITGLLVDMFNRESVTLYVHQPTRAPARMQMSVVPLRRGAALQLRASF